MLNKTYQQDIKFLESLSNIPKQQYMLGLDDRSVYLIRLKNFLQLLGNPQDKLKIIHIAGTSGKGTTVKLLESLMADSGLKTGSYTSPFATTSIEKLSINNKLISPGELNQILEKQIKPALDKYVTEFPTESISYFETFLAIGLLWFVKNKCDWVILEAGLGGTHDATNVITKPKVTTITNIGLDHTEILGDTKEKIARDKAGIIKRNSIFLTGEKNKKLLKIFKTVCRKKRAWLMKTENLTKQYQTDNYFQTKKQTGNLNLALNILNAIKVTPKNTQQLLDNFSLICRQEIIQKNPLVILDGSHNPDKLGNVVDFLKNQKYNKLHLVLGFTNEKNYRPALKKLLPLASNVYLTRFLITFRKTADLRKLYKTSIKISPKTPIKVLNDPWQALDQAMKKAGKKDLVLITGSFFLCGELRTKWITEKDIVKKLRLDNKL
ncbi:hypothetical protein HOB10_02435 [Candidatus Parcubacteria bacterium]|jgi:dihydrofolate synthase / folylpolyglutamate synthase|nr:hypothetical protein [Candidatus Parcubacteria bacterium]